MPDCEICHGSFANNDLLREHMRIIHKTSTLGEVIDVNSQIVPNVSDDVRRHWLFVKKVYKQHRYDSSSDGGEKVDQSWKNMTLSDFEGPVEENSMTKQSRQCRVIDKIWNSMVKTVTANKLGQNMIEPDYKPRKGYNYPLSLPSSFVDENKDKKPWQTLGIGFRCDSRKPADVLKQGFVPMYWDASRFMQEEHYIAQTMMFCPWSNTMHIFRDNVDAVGQSCVCVARSLLGATKFPETNATTNKKDKFHVWALDINDLNGFDLEEYQLPKFKAWRPGEKMFPCVEVDRILAHVEVIKHGEDKEKGGWKFEFKSDAKWTWHRRGLKKELMDYLDGELDRFKGKGVFLSTLDWQ